ncbi:hypothetical protein [Saccharothrix coeruleofusca]|uniref:Uncharacterized protein n=1 Tax=Saccharothrix coeruleofusca TaxID=33919 RepID=A0A918AV79_9PSEU|nr:hypothetical protein [Saccharothrix coeruleofusca]MBP2335760.1 hypothetical protein [Saccharothrix coeruleofusca]GGP75327.1 hypothetical protein GCM10010185_56220 [Saccharothrix coeruleofusca]
MTESDDAPLSPEAPRPPGTPHLEQLDVDVPAVPRDTPTSQDVTEEAGAVEPPD